MISVGIVGASGYTGEELARLLAYHPNVELKWSNNSSLCFQINNVIVWESKEF